MYSYRCDLAFCQGFNGGTTVAGTMMVAHAVGIRVFATGKMKIKIIASHT